MQELLRRLPALHELLERPRLAELLGAHAREVVVGLAREAIEDLRDRLRTGSDLEATFGSTEPDREALARRAETAVLDALDALHRPRLRSVLNATGVLLHTNLGRARLAPEVVEEVTRAARDAVALEIDLDANRRDGRNERVSRWLRLLTGAERAVVTNNGAAALWLTVRALAPRGRQVVVSRGEQVAIGGSFRMPELLRTTGARMREVGTTNRTELRDYAEDLEAGDLVLKVHPSNYRIEGFTAEVPLAELAELCRQRGAHLVFDAGSGSLYDFAQFGLGGEDPVGSSLRAGADVVTFSGDKLLGGPQAGLVVGRDELVRRVGRHPLMRALRCDKLVLAALEATLAVYGRTAAGARPALPLFDALATSVDELERRARTVAALIAPHLDSRWTAEVRVSSASVGGGSFARESVESRELRLLAPGPAAAARLHRALRVGTPGVLSRIDNSNIGIDFRALAESELEALVAALVAALPAAAAGPGGGSGRT